MKQVIYIDILIIVNLFVNYFMLLATAKFFCIKWKTSRLIFGEILSGIYSLYILAPELPIIISLIIKLLMSFTIIGTTFGLRKPLCFFKTLIYFYGVNFAFSGIMLAIWYMFKPNGMQINNGIVYFNISPIILIVSTLTSYMITEGINRIINRRYTDYKPLNLKITFKNKRIAVTAKIDTGNSLKEPFSNLPVVVAKESCLKPLISENTYEKLTNFLKEEIQSTNTNILNLKMRAIPFKTISEEGILPAFKPDFVKINGSEVQKEAYIAICPDKLMPTGISALINPEFLD